MGDRGLVQVLLYSSVTIDHACLCQRLLTLTGKSGSYQLITGSVFYYHLLELPLVAQRVVSAYNVGDLGSNPWMGGPLGSLTFARRNYMDGGAW